MRIVIRNVNKGFDRKIKALASLEPDLAILPESKESPKFPANAVYKWRWLGENPNSGLGILATAKHALGDLLQIGSDHRWVGVVRAGGITAIGVWAYYPRSPLKDEKGPVRSLLPQILDEAGDGPSILAGDFNNSAYWDKPGPAGNAISARAPFSSTNQVPGESARLRLPGLIGTRRVFPNGDSSFSYQLDLGLG